jgi:hypothetical protein
MAAASVGNIALFAGGRDMSGNSDIVDVYNTITGAITTIHLSEARRNACAAAVGNYIFVAGGINGPNWTDVSDRVDVFQVKQ